MKQPILPEAARALMELMLKCEKPYEAETLVEIAKDLTRGRAIPGVFNLMMIFEEPQGLYYMPISDTKAMVNKSSGGKYFRDVVRLAIEDGRPLLAVGVFSLTVANETGKEGICAVIETPEGNHLQIFTWEGEKLTEQPYTQQDAEKWAKDGVRLCNFFPPSVFVRPQAETIN